MASVPLYDATYALSHALRTVAESGSKTKPVDLTYVLAQIHAGVVAVPVPSAPLSSVTATMPVAVVAPAMPLTYRVEGKGKSK